VFTSYSDSSIRIWNIANPLSWILVRTYTGHSGPTYGIDFIRADTLVTGSLDKTIKIWRISAPQTLRTISAGTIVYSVAMLTDGATLASACSNRINLYNVNNGTLLRFVIASQSTITELLVISSTLLASAGFDFNIRIWNLTNTVPNAIQTMTGHTNNVYGLKRISADMIASASFDTTLRIWNISNGNLVRNLTGHTNSLQYSIDYLSCSVLASGSVGTEGIILWNIFSGQSQTISASGLQIQSLAVNGVTSSEFSLIFKILHFSIRSWAFFKRFANV
jgi:WD40 repeat protein